MAVSLMAYKPGIHGKPFSASVEAFRSGKDTPRAYLERCLAIIDVHEGDVKAFVVMNPEGARAAADAATKRYRDGRTLSAIDGMPIGIKDLYETADMPTQMGSPIFKGSHTKRDGAPVYALRQRGAIILGKTVTTELGFYHPGPTRNPFDTTRTPGGSSSGSAAAVAANMVPVAIGSQVVGSLIRPSSYCGNVGFKPSFGAINRGGGGTGLSQAVVGTHANCLEDAWSVAHEIVSVIGGDPGSPGLYGDSELAPAVKPARLIKIKTDGWQLASVTAKAQFDDVIKHLERLGVEIISAENDQRIADFEAILRDAKDLTHTLCGYELRWSLTVHRARGPGMLSETMLQRLDEWEKITPDQYRRALQRRADLQRAHAALEGIGSALITLSAAGAAPVGMETGDPVFAAPCSVLCAPALNLPLLIDQGMPLGLQLIGYRDSDARLFGTARWVAEAGPPRKH